MKRYDLNNDRWCGYEKYDATMDESEDGDWVRADEAMKRIAELEADKESLMSRFHSQAALIMLLERERDEARALVREGSEIFEFLPGYNEGIADFSTKCADAVKRWEGNE